MSQQVEEVLDVMVTVEIALLLHRNKSKHKVVAKVCRAMKHRLHGDVKKIVTFLSKQKDAYEWYSRFMNQAGL